MSTVLWANALIDGKARSEEQDYYALYKHAKKLDKLTTGLSTISFFSTQDFTDVQFNLNDDELPTGMESTDEVMAVNGVWVSGQDAVDMLEALVSHIEGKNIRFGLFSNATEDVLSELKASLDFAKQTRDAGGMFNFSVVT